MKLTKFLCLFLLVAIAFAFTSCDVLNQVLGSAGAGTQQAAKKFTVTFDSVGGSKVASQEVEADDYVTEPKEPTKEGYDFKGWYLGGKLWDFESQTVTKNITLKAKWAKAHVHDFSDPTCTEDGACKCGEVELEAYGHNWTAATCSAPKTCSRCGETEGEALAHTPGAAATCTTNQICTVCNKELAPALGHTPGEEATCNNAQDCTVCGAVLVEKLEHVYSELVVEPTCTSEGYTIYDCNNCDHEYIANYVDAIEHTYTTEVTAPTCTAEGYTTYVCVCGDNYVGDYTEKLEHEYETVVTEPTCETEGYTTYMCKNCGDSEVKDTVSATGHTPVVDEAVEATCTSTGLTAGVHCGVCNKVITAQEEIDMLPHTVAVDAAVDPTCQNTGLTEGSHCSVCGEVLVAQETVDAVDHNYDSVVTAPTCTSEGYTTHTCTFGCGSTYTDSTVAKLPHNHESVVTAPTCDTQGYTTHTCSACGDNYTTDIVPATGCVDGNLDGICDVCEKVFRVSHTVYYYINGQEVDNKLFYEDEGLDTLLSYEKVGYTFSGWSNMFTGAPVTSIAAGTTTDIRLTGSLIAIDYTVTYYVDGSANATQSYQISDVDTALSIADPVKPGFEFLGWFDADGALVTAIAANTIGDMELFAHFEEVVYTITYELNGGENNPDNASAYTYDSVPELFAPVSRNGYLFEGWFTNEAFSGAAVTSLESLKGSDITLYAKWSEIPNGNGTLTPEVPFG